MERSLVRFKEIVAGGWGQPYRFDRVQIPSDEVVEADPDQYRRHTNQKQDLIGPEPTPEMTAALLEKVLPAQNQKQRSGVRRGDVMGDEQKIPDPWGDPPPPSKRNKSDGGPWGSGTIPSPRQKDEIFEGPQGGKYRINKNGRKSYDVP